MDAGLSLSWKVVVASIEDPLECTALLLLLKGQLLRQSGPLRKRKPVVASHLNFSSGAQNPDFYVICQWLSVVAKWFNFLKKRKEKSRLKKKLWKKNAPGEEHITLLSFTLGFPGSRLPSGSEPAHLHPPGPGKAEWEELQSQRVARCDWVFEGE